jgi:hypothetical protein
MRVGDRRSKFTLDDGELVRCLLVGLAPLLDLDDDDKLLRALIRNRYRRAPTPSDLLDGRLDVVGRVVTPIHDQKVLDSADDEQPNVQRRIPNPGCTAKTPSFRKDMIPGMRENLTRNHSAIIKLLKFLIKS